MTYRVYLCGSIRKGASDSRPDDYFWTEDDETYIRRNVSFDLDLLNPAKSKIDRNDVFLNYGCDLSLVQSSSVILADLRREKGIGIGAELMFARFHGIPVVAYLPPHSHYHRELISDIAGQDVTEWIHPFVYGLCDYMEPNLESICNTLNDILPSVPSLRKVAPSTDEAIAYYKRMSAGENENGASG